MEKIAAEDYEMIALRIRAEQLNAENKALKSRLALEEVSCEQRVTEMSQQLEESKTQCEITENELEDIESEEELLRQSLEAAEERSRTYECSENEKNQHIEDMEYEIDDLRQELQNMEQEVGHYIGLYTEADEKCEELTNHIVEEEAELSSLRPMEELNEKLAVKERRQRSIMRVMRAQISEESEIIEQQLTDVRLSSIRGLRQAENECFGTGRGTAVLGDTDLEGFWQNFEIGQ